MATIAETPVPATDLLVTGHFNQRAGYSVHRSHGSGDWLLILTVNGRGHFGYRGGDYLAEPKDLVMTRPGTPHDYGVEPSLLHWELLWAHFRPRAHWHAWLNWPEAAPGLMTLRPDAGAAVQIERRFFEADRLAIGAQRRREAFAMNALEEVLLLCDAQNPLGSQAPADSRVRHAMEYLCLNLARKVTLTEVADEVSLSVSRMAHLFRRQAGVAPQQFLEHQRLDRAARLLETTQLSVKEIARQVGFDNPFYLTLRFKRRNGVGPREYRKRLVARAARP